MVKEKKSNLRKDVLTKRDGQSRQDINEKSAVIAERFLSIPEVKSGKIFLLYFAIKSEVNTRLIAEELLNIGKTVAFPRILGDNRMSLHKINSLEELADRQWSIPEPVEDAPQISPDEVDVAVIPGIAFDRHRCRLGWGGGYYDRFLPLSNCLSVGLAFDLQVVDDLPVEDHDHPLDMIITETKII